MKYRKIPFIKARGNTLMDGLVPLIAPHRFGPMYSNSAMLGASSSSGFIAEEDALNENGIINDNDMMFQRNRWGGKGSIRGGLSGMFQSERSAADNQGIVDYLERTISGAAVGSMRGLRGLHGRWAAPMSTGPRFAGSAPALGGIGPSGTTKVVLRPQPNAAPGFPGLFAWMKSELPDMYNYTKAALPQYITMIEGKRSGGATLSGLGDDGDDSVVSIPTPTTFTTDIDPGILSTVSIPDASAETAGAPAPSPNVANQIVSTLNQAATTLLPAINQQQIFQAQPSRAQAGLPPLNTSQYGLTAGLAALGDPTTLLIIGGGVLALVLLMKKG